MNKVVIVGNCQAQYLEGLFATASNLQVEKVAPNFVLTEADRQAVQQKLDEATLVFIQRTAKDFHLDWLSSHGILCAYPKKSWVWPNIYFDGFFPGTRYVYLQFWDKLQGPLEDYHLAPVLRAYKAGESITLAVSRLHEEPSNLVDPFEASLKNLHDREGDCTVLISDYVAEEVLKAKCFYTPNHPYLHLLVEMARRLAEASGACFSVDKALKWKYHLDKVQLPIFEWVQHKYGQPLVGPSLYKGLSVEDIRKYQVTLGVEKFYTPIQLVEQFYRIYDFALKAH